MSIRGKIVLKSQLMYKRKSASSFEKCVVTAYCGIGTGSNGKPVSAQLTLTEDYEKVEKPGQNPKNVILLEEANIDVSNLFQVYSNPGGMSASPSPSPHSSSQGGSSSGSISGSGSGSGTITSTDNMYPFNIVTKNGDIHEFLSESMNDRLRWVKLLQLLIAFPYSNIPDEPTNKPIKRFESLKSSQLDPKRYGADSVWPVYILPEEVGSRLSIIGTHTVPLKSCGRGIIGHLDIYNPGDPSTPLISWDRDRLKRAGKTENVEKAIQERRGSPPIHVRLDKHLKRWARKGEREAMPDPMCTAAGGALQKCWILLYEGITDPEGLASSLYSGNIICQETRDRVNLNSNTRRQKNAILLDAVESRLRTNPSDFSKFSAVLDNDPYLHVFADEFRSCYTKLASEKAPHHQVNGAEYSKRDVSSNCEHHASADSKHGFFSGVRRGIRKLFGAAKDTTISVVKEVLQIFKLDIKIDRKYKKRFDEYTNREQTRWWFEVWGDESALKTLESKWEEVHAQHKWRLETCPRLQQRS